MSTGVSCGVASTDSLAGHVDTPLRLLRLADAAQYRAKRAGLRWPVVAGQVGGGGERRPVRRRPTPAPRPGLGAGPGDARVRARPARRPHRRRPPDPARGGRRAPRHLVDAGGWWVSEAPGGGPQLITVATSVHRSGDPADARQAEQSKIGAVFDLAEFPATERAVRDAASFAVEIGLRGNDPDEESALVISGYRAVIGAGATAAGSGWLVEVFADTLTFQLIDFEPVLQALVAVAVVGAGATGGASAYRPLVLSGARADRRGRRRRTLGSPASRAPAPEVKRVAGPVAGAQPPPGAPAGTRAAEAGGAGRRRQVPRGERRQGQAVRPRAGAAARRRGLVRRGRRVRQRRRQGPAGRRRRHRHGDDRRAPGRADGQRLDREGRLVGRPHRREDHPDHRDGVPHVGPDGLPRRLGRARGSPTRSTCSPAAAAPGRSSGTRSGPAARSRRCARCSGRRRPAVPTSRRSATSS